MTDAPKPRYRVVILYSEGRYWWVIDSKRVGFSTARGPRFSRHRDAKAAARRLIAAIRAGDVDETEIA